MKALITGITGQDGTYLADFLLEKNYEVHGLVRPSSRPLPAHLDGRVILHTGDLTDLTSLTNVVKGMDEVYNLAAMSDVAASFSIPEATADTDALGPLRLLEACRGRGIRFYQAGTSEMFGSEAPPQSETTPFHPRSPYGLAKVYAHHATIHYREAYGLHASNGILFNHESPRRGERFVTRKVTKGVAAIVAGEADTLTLGNLDAYRDWGYAPEYVEAMWLMLQQDDPDDYVIATGEAHSVEELCEVAFDYVGLDWRKYVRTDPSLFRKSEVSALCGTAAKAEQRLGWRPRTTFRELVEIMLCADLKS